MKRRGLTLIEMLVVLGLIAAFAALASALFQSAFRTAASSSQNMADAATLDSAITALRRDVWEGARVDVRDCQSVAIQRPDNSQVLWQVGDDGALSRIAGDLRHDYRALPVDIRFTGDQNGLVLAITGRPPAPQREIAMVSQFMMLRRNTP
jgi:prepilin-type N-terminal cleavage/methylation domain-containing protein